MIRFIIRRKWRDAISGAESDGFESVLCDVPELERILSGGGSGQSGFDIRELAGAEIEQAATQPPAVGVDVSALRDLISGWRSMEGKPDGSYEEGYYDSRRHAAGELETTMTAALRTGGGDS